MTKPHAAEETYPRRWLALVLLLAGGFMNIMDVSVVNVALPRLQEVFRATSSQIEWVAAAYVLAFALSLLPLGRLGDRIGRKRMFLAGIASFTFFSALCGMAPNMEMLIVSRVLQGISAAMIMPQILASVQFIFPPHERMQAFSYFGFSAGLASIAGPLAGGLLIGANMFDLGWRWIFLINVPVGIFVIIAGRRIIPDIAGHPNVRNDWGGIVIAALMVFCLSFPLVEGHSIGWPAWTFVMMALSVPIGVVFAAHQNRRGRRGRSQLLPLNLLRDVNYSLGSAILLAIFAGAMGGFLPITLFLQQGFAFTPLQAGLTMAPYAVGVLVGSILMRPFGSGWVRGRIVLGAFAYCASMAVLRFLIADIGDAISPLVLAAPLFVSGIGMNFCIASVMRTAMADVPHRDAGSGSGALQTFQNLGSAFGIAIAGQIFFSSLATQFAGGADRHPAFVASLDASLIFNISAFVAVGMLALFLRPPPADADRRAQSPPVQVEV
jgi:EmrB/QacA subfamily drug resistance transporter